MTTKRFLSSVLAFVAIGVSARASTITYCASYCGANNIAAFDAATGGLESESPMSFSSLPSLLAVNGGGYDQYSDPSGLLFVDAEYGTTFSVVGGTLVAAADAESIDITVPASDTAVVVTLSAGQFSQYTIDGTTVNVSTTPEQFGFVNAAGGMGPITINQSSGGPLTIDSFNQAPQMSDTPEVGTLLLIGFGLIAMRWMRRVRSYFFRTPRPA